jgi:hypothetical protein
MSIKTNLGTVTAYADAKAHGYTGTQVQKKNSGKFWQILLNRLHRWQMIKKL